jgi:multiple sugar transport system permease protein
VKHIVKQILLEWAIKNCFNYFQMGYAAALAWMLFLLVLVLVLTLAVFKSTPMWVYYEGERGKR